MDFRGSYGSVRRYVTKRLAVLGKPRGRVNASRPVPARIPTPKQLSYEWARRGENREADAQARLNAIRACSNELDNALNLADEFAALIRKQSKSSLREWLARAESSQCRELRSFAEGVRRDESAVQAAVAEQWSNGPVEGHVNRLKTIKRQMYGRGGFRLLRARIVQSRMIDSAAGKPSQMLDHRKCGRTVLKRPVTRRYRSHPRRYCPIPRQGMQRYQAPSTTQTL